jgi:hypothetical protein
MKSHIVEESWEVSYSKARQTFSYFLFPFGAITALGVPGCTLVSMNPFFLLPYVGD